MLGSKMIDKISSWKYAENFNREPDHISVARDSAEQLGVESVTPATGAGLASIAAMLSAKNIVEAGTGAGVSGLWLLSASETSTLTTIDDEPEYQNQARTNFQLANVPASRARVITGRAAAVMANMTESAYDLVFLDIEPFDLEQLLPHAIGLVRPSGAIVISHALWRDRVPNPALRDDETSAMRAVVRVFEESEEFISSISMLGDGLLVAVRRPGAIS
jgi:predicted O-methyltransferase YrrM|tara:strand:- start:1403 stop:2059 length:657 start_codon:yes stop_codon:yes gene_type:complete